MSFSMYLTHQKMYYSVDESELELLENVQFIEHQMRYTVFKIKDSVETCAVM